MEFSVFISHSTADVGLVEQLRYWLEINGINVHVARFSVEAGTQFQDRIAEAIRNSDCILAIITKNGVRSSGVGYEIGLATTYNRRIVPIVEKGVTPPDYLSGIGWIPFDPMDPMAATRQAVEFIHDLRQNKDAESKTTATVLILLGLLALSAAASQKAETA